MNRAGGELTKFTMLTPAGSRLIPILAFAVVACAMCWHARMYTTFLSDDALISLRYAQRLVEGHGLTWTGQEHVEGYTDFLWVILTALGGFCRLGYISVARGLDLFGVLLAVWVVGVSPRTGRLSVRRLAFGGGLLATSIPMAVWANGGLEHGFMTGVLAIALYRIERRGRTSSVAIDWVGGMAMLALVWLRADGIVLVAFALLGALLVTCVLARSQRSLLGLKGLVLTAFSPGVAFASQLLFRKIYYGAWQPNTAAAKLAFNEDRIWGGFHHVTQGFSALSVLVAIALIASVYLIRKRELWPVLPAWCVVLGWSLYLALVGGDIFPGWRQLIFVIPPLASIAAAFAEKQTPSRWMTAIVVVSAFAVSSVHFIVQESDSENQRAKTEVWEWDGYAIGTLLCEAFGALSPLLAVDAAGALPYWSGLPSIDMLGLNDAYIAHHPPATFGHGGIGHELGDGAYVLSRAPDIIAFNNASGSREPLFLSGRQILQLSEFGQTYQWIRAQSRVGNQTFAELWVRREGGRLGIRRTPETILIPGMFLTGSESASVARLGPDHRLAAEVSALFPGVIPAFTVPEGRWKVELSPALPDAVISLRCGALSMQHVGLGTPLVLSLTQPTQLTLAIAPPQSTGPNAIPIAQIVLSRAPDSEPATHTCANEDEKLRTLLADLSLAKKENSDWSAPGNLIVGPTGLVVTAVSRTNIHRIELSVDNNDTYSLEIARNGQVRWLGTVAPKLNGGGMSVQTIAIPEGLEIAAGDEISIVPSQGDGTYSVGHLLLEN